jgi:hypothetical protein
VHLIRDVFISEISNKLSNKILYEASTFLGSSSYKPGRRLEMSGRNYAVHEMYTRILCMPKLIFSGGHSTDLQGTPRVRVRIIQGSLYGHLEIIAR